ncbi:leucine-rich repeat domain-containing protein [Chitinophaga oryzae]|uniref:Leucine-rich repeat domain-containing protein n=1 Tax=Chitinophaga oryzae TaxID=2725414 RepID=A0AAE7D8W3_9BACT|nr:leucine-rich repeat domain-containing protein [Chitinophaga oryzae]QJB33828.1 leucine-rich repeat domain-containing protein [Chitinophaga oryzae]
MDYFETHVMKNAQATGYVDLQRKRLSTLPRGYEAAAKLPYVHVDLSGNRELQHDTVINQLAAVPHMQALSMAFTGMEELPAGIIRLSGLQCLDLSHNKLKTLPSFIAGLQQLKVLKLNNNKLSGLPHLPQPLPLLEELHLGGNTLAALADSDLSMFPALKKLYLDGGQFTRLPASVTRLSQLEILVLDNNGFLKITDACRLLAGCGALRRLSMQNCDVSVSPDGLTALQQITALDLRKNMLRSIPHMPRLTSIECDWPLPAPFYFNMIKDRPDISSLQLFKILPYEEDGVRTLPANTGELQYLDSITFTDLQRIPATVNKLAQLTSLSFINGEYAALPDLSGLQAIAHVLVSGTRFAAFPEFIYQLPALKTLTIERCTVRPDYARIARLPALEKITTDDVTDTDLQHFLQPVHGRSIDVVITAAQLPDAYYDLPCVQVFDLNQYEAIDVHHALSMLHRLPNLHTLIFNKVRPLPAADCIRWLQQLPRLKEVTLYPDEQTVPASLAGLPHLEHIRLFWNEHYWGIPHLPPAVANTRPGQLVLENKPSMKAYRHAFEVLQNRQITGTATRELAFCLLARRYDELKQRVPWPFTPEGQLPGAQVYIAGEPTLCTRKALKAVLQQRGAAIVGEIAAATHVFVGQHISATAVVQLSGHPVQLVLEDHLKAQTWKEEAPFLMEEGGQELVSQVTRLLKTDGKLPLALQVISGGGANRVLISYLAALHLFHRNDTIASEAKGLFRKFASAALQHHIDVTWSDTFRYKREDEFSALYLHPELDMFAFLLACFRARGVDGRTNLWLKHIPDTAVTDSIRDMLPVNMLSIESPGNAAITKLLEKLPLMQLQNLVIEAPITALPSEVWQMPALQNITLRLKGSPGFTIPPLGPNQVAFPRLSLEGAPLLHPERVSAWDKLTSCILRDCSLQHADFLAGMCQLELLDISNNNLAALPAGMRAFDRLSSLAIEGNNISEKDVDALLLPLLDVLNNMRYSKKY